MRVLRHWQGRGKLFASGSPLLTVGYYCQEIETTLKCPRSLRHSECEFSVDFRFQRG